MYILVGFNVSQMIGKRISFAFSQVLRFKDYSICRLTEEHRSPALEFLKEQFFKSEPSELAFYKQFPQQKANSYLHWQRVERLFSEEVFQRGLSFGCFDVQNGYQLVGAVIAKDHSVSTVDPAPQEGSYLHAVKKLRESLLAQVIPEFREVVKSNPPMVELWIVAIKPQHRLKGLLRKMVGPIEHFGALQSYQYSISEATNPRIAQSYERLGYKKIAEADAREFEDGGVKYFREIDNEQRHRSLWIKKLEKPSQMQMQEK